MSKLNLSETFKHCKFIDLSHDLEASVPTWNGSCGFEQTIKMDYEQGCRVQSIKMHAGVGTHMDAPSHFIPNEISIADLALKKLIVTACVINVSAKAKVNFKLSEQDVMEFEEKFGTIPDNSFVIAYTGWDKFWKDPIKYRNENVEGNMVFPSISKEAATLLLKRNIAGIGIDTLSPDCPESDFPVHHLMLGASKYIVENLANCASLPPTGSYILILPPKIVAGTESIVRAVSIVPKI